MISQKSVCYKILIISPHHWQHHHHQASSRQDHALLLVTEESMISCKSLCDKISRRTPWNPTAPPPFFSPKLTNPMSIHFLGENHNCFWKSIFVDMHLFSSVLAAWNRTRVGSVLRHKGEFWQTPLRTPQSPPTVERGLIKGPSWGQGVLGETSLLLRTANSNENRIFEKNMNHSIQSRTELYWCRTCISIILCGAQNWKHLE